MPLPQAEGTSRDMFQVLLHKPPRKGRQGKGRNALLQPAGRRLASHLPHRVAALRARGKQSYAKARAAAEPKAAGTACAAGLDPENRRPDVQFGE